MYYATFLCIKLTRIYLVKQGQVQLLDFTLDVSFCIELDLTPEFNVKASISLINEIHKILE